MPTSANRSRLSQSASLDVADAVVLGVEPDAVTRGLVALYLEPHGYRVEIAEDVVTALARLEQGHPTLFLCSQLGLERAAPEAVTRLREVLSEVPMASLLEPGMAPGMVRGWPTVRAHLTKPLQADALLAALKPPRNPLDAAANGRTAEQGRTTQAALEGFAALITEMEMDVTMVRELTNSFLERAPLYLDDIVGGLAEGKLEQVDRAAHTMKGMCGNLRFNGLMELSDNVRMAAQAGDTLRLELLLASLQEALTSVSDAVRRRWLGEAHPGR